MFVSANKNELDIVFVKIDGDRFAVDVDRYLKKPVKYIEVKFTIDLKKA